jgi:predicted GNAT family N-acyltransferase
MQIRAADFEADHDAIRDVRFTVFVDEQRVPAEIEIDDRDAHCRHVLAFDGERAVGTGRIDLEHGGKIGRVAVVAAARGSGVGTALMRLLHEMARDYGLAGVWCHAQVSAVPFYQRLGYRASGPRFLEADIEHVRMDLRFRDARDS